VLQGVLTNTISGLGRIEKFILFQLVENGVPGFRLVDQLDPIQALRSD